MKVPVRKALAVEGTDDQHVLLALMKHHGMERSFDVLPQKGVDNLLDALPTLLKTYEGGRLGILLDADLEPNSQWNRVRDRLRASLPGAPIPDEPVAGGFVVELDDRRVGVWLMPDNALPGALEDFLRAIVPAGDVVWPRVASFVASLEGEARRFPSHHANKALVHTFLAVQEEPGKPYGQAITARYLAADGPAAEPFVAWLRRLFLDA